MATLDAADGEAAAKRQRWAAGQRTAWTRAAAASNASASWTATREQQLDLEDDFQSFFHR